MSKTIYDYFHTEMQLLNESVYYYAKEHPKAAARLNLDSYAERDPHIERLLEGSAYLNARVKQQIDLGVHHVSESLLRQLAPAYLAPRPAMTMVEFNSVDNSLVQSEHLPSGITLYSHPVGDEQTVCEFTTLQELTLYPLSLTSVDRVRKKDTAYSLQLSFKLNEGIDPTCLQHVSLPLFINSTPIAARQWYYYLTRAVRSLTVSTAEGDEQRIGGQELLTRGSVNNESIRDQTNPFEHLEDFFHFPERCLLIKLNLYNIPFEPTFTITVDFTEDLADLHIQQHLFKLHCVPAINLFTTHSEPILYHENRDEYPVLISQEQTNSKKLFAIQRVQALETKGSDIVEFKRFHDSTHFDSDKYCYYRLSQIYHTPERVEERLVFSGALQPRMSISCDVIASNGHYPRQFLSVNSLFVKDSRVSLQLQATNITRPSRYYHPVFDSQYAALVLSTLHVNVEKLANISFLKQLLTLHDWPGNSAGLIDAISNITIKPFNRVHRGTVLRGFQFVLKINPSPDLSRAEFNLFGEMIHVLIGQFRLLNMQWETILILLPSEFTLKWSSDGPSPT